MINFVNMLSKLFNILGIGALLSFIQVAMVNTPLNVYSVILIGIISIILSYMFDIWQTTEYYNSLGKDDDENNF